MPSVRALIPTLLAGIMLLTVALPADARSAARMQLTAAPTRVRIGGKVTLTGSHLPANRYVIGLFVPQKKPKLRRFLPLMRTDRHGSLRSRVTLPIVAYCGPAYVYVTLPKKTLARTRLQVYGCKPSRKTPPPPPPPKP